MYFFPFCYFIQLFCFVLSFFSHFLNLFVELLSMFLLIFRSRAHFISSSLTLSGEEELEVKKRRDDAHTRYTKLRTELHSSKMVLQQLDNLTHNGDSGDC